MEGEIHWTRGQHRGAIGPAIGSGLGPPVPIQLTPLDRVPVGGELSAHNYAEEW